MKKWMTRVPTRFNDGSPVPESMLNEVFYLIAKEFCRASIDGPGRGIWFDTNGQIYDEPSYLVSVVCDEVQLKSAEKLVVQIGNMLDQKAMYFETANGTVENLSTE